MRHGWWGKENQHAIQAMSSSPQLFSSQETILQAGSTRCHSLESGSLLHKMLSSREYHLFIYSVFPGTWGVRRAACAPINQP